MLPTDTITLKDRIAELAEVFERKPVTERALKVWFDTLREFRIEQVAGVLIGWPKSHGKFPTPAELWKVCNEISIAEREKRAALEKRDEIAWERSPQGAKFLEQMRQIINRPKRTPKEHWEHLLATKEPGSIGYEYAKQVLGREPGEDDEPQAVNF